MAAAAPDAKLVPGADLDGFIVGEVLHVGAMGAIHRVAAGPSRSAREFPLIMKVPRAGIGDGGEGLLGFETEAMVLPLLTGTHLPRFVAGGDIARQPYLVVEWVEGKSVATLLQGGRMPAEEAARIGSGIADALYELHRQEAIHLDLKPDNIIVRPSGEIVLIDFGMAHHARCPDLLAEEKRFASGSAPYVSPEQVLGSRSDPRSDLFALGVILYEMVTGELPFGSPASLAALKDRLWLDPAPPGAFVPGLPNWLQEIILRCLETDAELRYQSAAHLAFDLRNPSHVPLTERSTKLRRAGLWKQMGRWWTSRPGRIGADAPRRAPSAPVILVAVDTMHPDDPRHPAIRNTVARVLSVSAEFRLIFVSVVQGEPVGGGDGTGIHLEHLVRLRHWIEPLRLPAARCSMHVIEALNPAATLLEFARHNNVDLIIIGAPSPAQQALAWWRSVASGVTANAECSVHVVRVAEGRSAGKPS